jgi:hypothetical protein
MFVILYLPVPFLQFPPVCGSGDPGGTPRNAGFPEGSEEGEYGALLLTYGKGVDGLTGAGIGVVSLP